MAIRYWVWKTFRLFWNSVRYWGTINVSFDWLQSITKLSWFSLLNTITYWVNETLRCWNQPITKRSWFSLWRQPTTELTRHFADESISYWVELHQELDLARNYNRSWFPGILLSESLVIFEKFRFHTIPSLKEFPSFSLHHQHEETTHSKPFNLQILTVSFSYPYNFQTCQELNLVNTFILFFLSCTLEPY
jgi:hypothetical protein